VFGGNEYLMKISHGKLPLVECSGMRLMIMWCPTLSEPSPDSREKICQNFVSDMNLIKSRQINSAICSARQPQKHRSFKNFFVDRDMQIFAPSKRFTSFRFIKFIGKLSDFVTILVKVRLLRLMVE
jgi:hypothetical protein